MIRKCTAHKTCTHVAQHRKLSPGEIFYRLPDRENPDSRMLLDNLNTLTKEVIHNVNFIPSEVFKQEDYWPTMIMHRLQLNTFTLSW